MSGRTQAGQCAQDARRARHARRADRDDRRRHQGSARPRADDADRGAGRAQRRYGGRDVATSRSSATTRPRMRAIEGLNKAAGFLRGRLGRRLGLQHAPELRFMLDPSIDVARSSRRSSARTRSARGRPAATSKPSRRNPSRERRRRTSPRRRSRGDGHRRQTEPVETLDVAGRAGARVRQAARRRSGSC